MPSEFISLDSFEGNPPTILMPILYLMEEGEIEFIQKIFWPLEKWMKWLINTQTHTDLYEEDLLEKDFFFRWKCKGSCESGNFLGSGLDDYPRFDKGTVSKGHLDLHCWLIFFAESMCKLSQSLSHKEKY